jgi:signal-transduction protein with cAMP-binding, CBS, and nucleotidyltransferase domain
MLKKGVKKLPVIEAKELVGIITITDIAATHPKLVKYMKELADKYDIPQRIEKVINYYVV